MSVASRMVYLRGLIEISNKCRKNCLYCGIRAGNTNVCRYELSDDQILREAQFALDSGYGSVVLQGGERTESAYVERIARLVWQIKRLQPSPYGANLSSSNLLPDSSSMGYNLGKEITSKSLGITLSLGEQSREVYREWYNAGAHRYLLRIEASNRELYEKIHPQIESEEDLSGCGDCKDELLGREKRNLHSYDNRMAALYDLKSVGYITGSGVMIALPYQTREHLEEDLQFFKRFGVDMVGMGPYIPHKDTPLGRVVLDGMERLKRGEKVPDLGEFAYIGNEEKLNLSIDMIRRLRKLMPNINIAATTALQVLSPDGRERAVLAGANVIMPNITETSQRQNYQLYEGKPGVNDDAESTKFELEKNLAAIGAEIGWWQAGDPQV